MTPINPDDYYIKCDNCHDWFHPKCEDINEEDVENMNNFNCKKCKLSK